MARERSHMARETVITHGRREIDHTWPDSEWSHVAGERVVTHGRELFALPPARVERPPITGVSEKSRALTRVLPG